MAHRQHVVRIGDADFALPGHLDVFERHPVLVVVERHPFGEALDPHVEDHRRAGPVARHRDAGVPAVRPRADRDAIHGAAIAGDEINPDRAGIPAPRIHREIEDAVAKGPVSTAAEVVLFVALRARGDDPVGLRRIGVTGRVVLELDDHALPRFADEHEHRAPARAEVFPLLHARHPDAALDRPGDEIGAVREPDERVRAVAALVNVRGDRLRDGHRIIRHAVALRAVVFDVRHAGIFWGNKGPLGRRRRAESAGGKNKGN